MLFFIFTIVSCIFVWKIFFPIPEPINGIYSQPGKRGILKQIFMYALLQLRKYKSDGKPSDEVGLGVKSAKNIKELESVKVIIFKEINLEIRDNNIQELGTSPLAIDAVLFTGNNMVFKIKLLKEVCVKVDLKMEPTLSWQQPEEQTKSSSVF